MKKSWIVILLAMPALSFAACIGTWAPTTDKWGVAGNWSACGGEYPGQTGTTSIALFTGATPLSVIVGDSGGVGISPSVGRIQLGGANYSLNPGTGTSTIQFYNDAGLSNLQVLSFSQQINVPIVINNPGTLFVSVNSNGQLFFSQVSSTGTQDVSMISDGSNAMLHNINNVDGFVIGGAFILNVNLGAQETFNHLNNAPVNSGAGSLLRAQTFEIMGGVSNAGLNCINDGAVSGTDVYGAWIEATSFVNLSPQGTAVANLQITNSGNITNEGKGSYLTTPIFQGVGNLSVLNTGNVAGVTSFPTIGAGITTDHIDFQGTAVFENTSNSVESGGYGVVLLGDVSADSFTFNDFTFRNTGNFATTGDQFAYGVFCSTPGDLIFNSNTQIVNTGSFSSGNTSSAFGCSMKGFRLEFTGDASQSTIANFGNVLFSSFQMTSASVGVDIVANTFIKSGKGLLSVSNEGAVGVNQGVSIINIGPGNIVMADGEWIAVNAAAVSNPQIVGDESVYGIQMTSQEGVEIQSGVFSLKNLGEISQQGVGVGLISSKDYVQTGGHLILVKTPEGLVDSTSNGVVLAGFTSLQISGGTLENNERVLVKNEVNLTGSGIVKGTGIFAGLEAKLSDLGFFTSFNNSGRVVPGNSPGTLTIQAPYIQSGAGTLEIHVCGQEHSLLNIIGSAQLAGNLELVGDTGCAIDCNDEFTILQATGGVTGTFDQVLNFLGTGVTPVVSYLPNSVVLSLVCDSCCCPPLCAYLGNVTQTIFASLTDTNNFFIKRQLQQLQERVIDSKQNAHVYVGPIGSVGRSGQDKGEVGFHYGSVGGVIGGDYALPQGGVGGLITYEWIGSDDVACQWGNFHIQRVQGSLYGSYVPKALPAFSLDLMAGGGYDSYHIRRSGSSGSPNGYELDTMLSLEYRATLREYHLTPMANLQYIFLHIDDYCEEGGRPICYDDQRAKSLSTVLGLWGERTWKWKQPFTTQVNLGWQREYLNHDRRLCSSAGSLDMEGAKRNNLLAGIDLLWQVKEGWAIEASYDLIWNSQFNRNGFYLGLNANF